MGAFGSCETFIPAICELSTHSLATGSSIGIWMVISAIERQNWFQLCQTTFCMMCPMNELNGTNLDKQAVQTITMMKKFFAKHSLNWWVEAGTALAAWRDGKMMPWDPTTLMSLFGMKIAPAKGIGLIILTTVLWKSLSKKTFHTLII